MALRPTEEQLKAVEAYRSGQDLKVVAVAGSGKVERLLERSRPYICLIRSVRVGRISGRLCLL